MKPLAPFASFHPAGRPTEAVLSVVVTVLRVLDAAAAVGADTSSMPHVVAAARTRMRTAF
jgi:hypothetical protein